MEKNPRQKRIVIALNPYLNKPVGIRQTNPGNLPVPGGYPPQMPGYPDGSAGPQYPGVPSAPYYPGQPASPANASSGLLGSFNMDQIKQFIDRMGGIEGIVNTLTRVQKLVQSVQQVAPMLKLLLPKSGAKTAAEEEEDEWDDVPPRRRRPRSRKRSYGPRTAAGGRRRKPRPYGSYGPRPGSRRRTAGRR
jgi:hypothetical protein